MAGLNAGTAYVDILPRASKGFAASLTGMFKSPLGKAGLIAGGAAVAGVAAGVAVGVKSVNAFAALEEGMNEVFTLLPDISGQAMSQMTDDVRDLAKEMGVLPNDVVPALYQSISAGVPQGDVFDFLEVASKTAIGGVTELDTAVDGLSSIVNAWGLEASEAADVSDAMFTAMRLGKTTVGELSSSIATVAPIAAEVGVGFDDILGATAALTKGGTPTAQAMNQLRATLVAMLRPTSDMESAFNALGFESGRAMIEALGLQGAAEALADHADEAGIEMVKLTGRVEGAQAILGLTGERAGDANEILGEMADRAGATDTAFEQMDQGLKRTWERIKVTFVTTLTEIGERLAPFVQQFLDFVSVALPKALDFLSAAFGPIIDIIGSVFETLTRLFSGATDEAEGMGGRFSGIMAGVTGIFESAGAIFSQVGELITLVFAALADFWDEWGDTIMAIFGGAFANVVTILETAFGIIQGLFDIVLGILTGDWRRAWEGVQRIFGSVIDGVLGILQNFFDTIRNIWHSLFGNSIIVDSVRNALARVLAFFAELPGKIFGFLAGLPGRFIRLGADLVGGLLSGLGNIVSTVGNRIKSGISGAVSSVKSFFGIGSPSKVIAKEIGGPLLEGIIAPFTTGDRAVARAITSTVTAGAAAGAKAAERALASGATGPHARMAGPAAGFEAADTATTGDGAMVFEDGAITLVYPEKEEASIALPRELRRMQYTHSRG